MRTSFTGVIFNNFEKKTLRGQKKKSLKPLGKEDPVIWREVRRNFQKGKIQREKSLH